VAGKKCFQKESTKRDLEFKRVLAHIYGRETKNGKLMDRWDWLQLSLHLLKFFKVLNF
jgi:hypothetical protein